MSEMSKHVVILPICKNKRFLNLNLNLAMDEIALKRKILFCNDTQRDCEEIRCVSHCSRYV